MSNALPAKLRGTVRHFKGNGRKLGYPTANIDANTNLADGVYFGFADLEQYTHQPALVFIGTPTTVGDTGRRVETHLLDIADVDYYGHDITLDVQFFHRSNLTFDSIDELLVAMKNDETTARAWFATNV
jgi:riboflavin kinase/FMN adenylyltransferase